MKTGSLLHNMWNGTLLENNNLPPLSASRYQLCMWEGEVMGRRYFRNLYFSFVVFQVFMSHSVSFYILFLNQACCERFCPLPIPHIFHHMPTKTILRCFLFKKKKERKKKEDIPEQKIEPPTTVLPPYFIIIFLLQKKKKKKEKKSGSAYVGRACIWN